MRFSVPQFLEIEDKIFGPLTFREFVYLVGGLGMCFILYKLLGLIIGAIPILIIVGFSLALAFYKPNNKPFLNVVESAFKYLVQSKLYIWKKNTSKKKNAEKQLEEKNKTGILNKRETKLTKGKLRDLAWSLNVLDLSKQKNNTNN